jgi:hypothetical protein
MKGSIEIVDMTVMLAVAVMFVLLMTQIPKILKEFFDQLALSTSKVVVHDLTGMISISAAAPQDIVISYNGLFKEIRYNADLGNREMKVQMIKEGELVGEISSNQYAVSSLQKNIPNCIIFKVSKNRNNFDNNYDFWCDG